jgi:hypothetical protein
VTSPIQGANVEDPLAEQSAVTPGQPSTVRTGTITAVSAAGVIQVTMGGTVIDNASLGISGFYRPRVGDTVALLGQSVEGSQSSGSTWLIIGQITSAEAGDWGTVTNYNVEPFTTSSGAYTTAGPSSFVGVPFYAPPSGKILVSWSAELRNTTDGQFTLISPQIAAGAALGSGAVLVPFSDDRQIRNDNIQLVRSSDTDLISGLTPGLQMNCTLYHRIGGGTGPISRRRVTVAPAF